MSKVKQIGLKILNKIIKFLAFIKSLIILLISDILSNRKKLFWKWNLFLYVAGGYEL